MSGSLSNFSLYNRGSHYPIPYTVGDASMTLPGMKRGQKAYRICYREGEH
jgi:hypothetical protein